MFKLSPNRTLGGGREKGGGGGGEGISLECLLSVGKKTFGALFPAF